MGFEEDLLTYEEAEMMRQKFVYEKVSIHKLAVDSGISYAIVKKILENKVHPNLAVYEKKQRVDQVE